MTTSHTIDSTIEPFVVVPWAEQCVGFMGIGGILD